MKRFTVTLLLSIFLACGSGVAFADNHHGSNRNRHEHREKPRKPSFSNDHRGKGPKEFGKPAHGPQGPAKHFDKRPHHTDERYRKQHHKAERRYEIEQDRRFHAMVANAARGGSDVRVWRINPDTYIVKYRIGHRWYTRRFYPHTGRFDAPGIININWNPMSGWTLLPSININIPF
ncbi:MAG: hypothetical protein K2K97_07245 [Muribaculaceae bacterium]|nr:hypothetical protein [Muribaculaceae bacterium]